MVDPWAPSSIFTLHARPLTPRLCCLDWIELPPHRRPPEPLVRIRYLDLSLEPNPCPPCAGQLHGRLLITAGIPPHTHPHHTTPHHARSSWTLVCVAWSNLDDARGFALEGQGSLRRASDRSNTSVLLAGPGGGANEGSGTNSPAQEQARRASGGRRMSVGGKPSSNTAKVFGKNFEKKLAVKQVGTNRGSKPPPPAAPPLL